MLKNLNELNLAYAGFFLHVFGTMADEENDTVSIIKIA